jgi:ATP-dependent Lon protease
MRVPLYVFEARYRELVRYCLEQETLQFLTALGKAAETLSDADLPFHNTACLMQILELAENPDGTYYLLAYGQERCQLEIVEKKRIQDKDGVERPLFFSDLKPLPLGRNDPNLERVVAWDAATVFRDYARVFFTKPVAQSAENSLPEEIDLQASFICANIRIPAEQRQQLLEAPTLIKRFELAQKLMEERLAAHASTQSA